MPVSGVALGELGVADESRHVGSLQSSPRRKHRPLQLITALAAALGLTVCAVTPAFAGSGGVTYTYDALGRVLTVNYDTGVIVIYTYDSNGNRTVQTINANSQSLCLGTTAHGNPTKWGQGLWSNSGPGC